MLGLQVFENKPQHDDSNNSIMLDIYIFRSDNLSSYMQNLIASINIDDVRKQEDQLYDVEIYARDVTYKDEKQHEAVDKLRTSKQQVLYVSCLKIRSGYRSDYGTRSIELQVWQSCETQIRGFCPAFIHLGWLGLGVIVPVKYKIIPKIKQKLASLVQVVMHRTYVPYRYVVRFPMNAFLDFLLVISSED